MDSKVIKLKKRRLYLSDFMHGQQNHSSVNSFGRLAWECPEQVPRYIELGTDYV